MNTRDYEYALAVARTRSFSRAAEACGVSQPTLSGQIRKLERNLGLELFERDGRTIRVSSAGSAILEQAQAAVSAVERIADLAKAGADPFVGTLRIGFIPTIAPYVLAQLLPLFREALPHAPLAVSEDVTPRIVQAVHEGRLDAAVVATDHSREDLSEIVLFEEPFLLAVPAAHPLAMRTSLALCEIDPSSLILLADGHCLRDQALSLCADTRIGRNIVADLSATSLETLMQLVRAGMGMTIIPQMALHHIGLQGIVVLPLRDNHAMRRVRLIHRPFISRKHALEKLATAITSAQENFKNLPGL